MLLKKEPAIGDGSQSGRKRRQCKSIRGSVMCRNSHKWKETLAALVRSRCRLSVFRSIGASARFAKQAPRRGGYTETCGRRSKAASVPGTLFLAWHFYLHAEIFFLTSTMNVRSSIPQAKNCRTSTLLGGKRQSLPVRQSAISTVSFSRGENGG